MFCERYTAASSSRKPILSRRTRRVSLAIDLIIATLLAFHSPAKRARMQPKGVLSDSEFHVELLASLHAERTPILSLYDRFVRTTEQAVLGIEAGHVLSVVCLFPSNSRSTPTVRRRRTNTDCSFTRSLRLTMRCCSSPSFDFLSEEHKTKHGRRESHLFSPFAIFERISPSALLATVHPEQSLAIFHGVVYAEIGLLRVKRKLCRLSSALVRHAPLD